MDIRILLQTFFENAAVFLPGQALVAATVARLVHAVLKEVGFDPVEVVEPLGRLGFEVGKDLLLELIGTAKSGIKSLVKWFETKLTTSVAVNEAATKVLIEQTELIASVVQEALPDDKEELVDTMQEGLETYGGAAAEIAELYSAALKDLNQLPELVEEMKRKLEIWASQTIEAKRSSLIENVEQTIEGRAGGNQEVRAEDDSVISGVKQMIRGQSESKND